MCLASISLSHGAAGCRRGLGPSLFVALQLRIGIDRRPVVFLHSLGSIAGVGLTPAMPSNKRADECRRMSTNPCCANKRRCLAQDGSCDSLPAILQHERAPCGGAQEGSAPELGRRIVLALQDAQINKLSFVALVPGPLRETNKDPLVGGKSPAPRQHVLGRHGL